MYILTKCAQMQNLWTAWWSKGQSFWVGVELDLWWIKPPASEGTGMFTWRMRGLCMFLDLNLKLKLLLFFFFPTCHTGSEWTAGAGQSCCSGSSWGDGCRLRNTMVCPVFSVFGAVEISDRFWGDPLDMANLSEFIFWSTSCKTPIMEVWNLDWLISELWCSHSGEVLASSGT